MIYLVHRDARHKDEKINLLGQKLQEKVVQRGPIYLRERRSLAEREWVCDGGEEKNLSSGGVGEFDGWGTGKFGDEEEVELDGGEEDRQTWATLARGGLQSPETSIQDEECFNGGR